MKRLFAATALAALLPAHAHAGSFAINENSANDLGRANAGRVVSTQDAQAAFGNPALMVHFDRATVTSTLSFINGEAGFAEDGSSDALGRPLGGDVDDAFADAFVPALQGVLPIGDRVALGLSVNAPFGLASRYPEGSVARYQAIDSELFTLNVNPSVGVAVSDTLSIGGGISVQYADVILSNSIDFGTIQAGLGGPPALIASNDGRVELTGDDWSVGWNIGAAWMSGERVTVGIHYRSEVDHLIEGEADFTVPVTAQALTAGGRFTDSEATAALDLPASLELGVRLSLSDRVDLYADVTRQYWGDLEGLRVVFDNPAQPDTVEELNYGTADRFALGADWEASADWSLRAGVAWDESPSDPEFATARIPDNDRLFLAAGATWRGLADGPGLLHGVQLDFAYNRIVVDDTDFARRDATGNLLAGRVEAGVNIFALGATKRF